MKQYMLSLYQPDGPVPPPEVLAKIMQELGDVNRDIKAAGRWVFAAGLHSPSTATVVRTDGAEILITDGPFAESKEHIGGFTIVRAADLDEALGWAERIARITRLSIEVRPLQDEAAG